MLVLFYFIIAWKEPYPPIPEYGIELGFSQSAGAPAAAAPAPEEEVVEEEVEEVVEAASEEIQEVESSTAQDEAEVMEEVESDVVDNQTPVEVQEASLETSQSEFVSEQGEEPTEMIEEVLEEETVQEVDNRALMTEKTEADANVPNDNPADGEDEEEEKELDQRAIYGSQGKNTGEAEGANLSLSGWVWDFKPSPKDTSDETGKIVYKIVVDSDGYLIKIETVTSTVSPSVERKYRQEVEKLTFSKTADYRSAPVSTGTVTFIIRTK